MLSANHLKEDKTYPILFQVMGKNIGQSVNEIKNNKNQIEYLREDYDPAGDPIYIYDLKPNLVRIRAYANDGFCLMANDDEKRTVIMLALNKYFWATYKGENRLSFISKESNLALDIIGGNFRDGTNIELWH